MLAGDPHFQRGGGESKVMLQQRTVAAIEEIVAAQQGKQVAIVSHGGTIRTYLAHVLEMPLERIFTRFRLGNTSLSIVRLPTDGSVPTLVSVNDMAHLEAWATL
jgi:broad specificity phosphatase PhoE